MKVNYGTIDELRKQPTPHGWDDERFAELDEAVRRLWNVAAEYPPVVALSALLSALVNTAAHVTKRECITEMLGTLTDGLRTGVLHKVGGGEA